MNNIIINRDPSKVAVLEHSANSAIFPTVDQGVGCEQKVSPRASVDTSNQVLNTREVENQPRVVKLKKKNILPAASVDTSNKVLDTNEVENKSVTVRLNSKNQSTLEKIFSGKCDLRGKDVEHLIQALGGHIKLQSPYTGAIFWGDSQKKAGVYERRVEDGGWSVKRVDFVRNAIEAGVRMGCIPGELIQQF